MEQAFAVSLRAAEQIASIVAAQPRPAALRVAVLAGGCSGFQYKFELDEAVQPDDLVVESGTARVLGGPASLDLLAGSELDYTDELNGQPLHGAESEREERLRLRHQFRGRLSGWGRG